MKIQESVIHMSKSYLDRIVQSFAKDVKKLTEEESRQFIEKNIKDLKQVEYILKKLDFLELSIEMRSFAKEFLCFMLLQRNQSISEQTIYEDFDKYLREKIRRIKDQSTLSTISKEKVMIIQTVAEVILFDEKISTDEHNILVKLKEKLKLTENQFDSIINTVRKIEKLKLPSKDQMDLIIKELQYLGLLYYLNRDVKVKLFVIPEEITEIIAPKFDYPLDNKSFALLFERFSQSTLRKIAKEKNISVSLSKDTIITKLFDLGTNPHQLLNSIEQKEIKAVAGKLDKVRISGTKEELINNVLKYFFYLDTNPIVVNADENESLWNYYEDLAGRDYAKLRQLKIIKKDLEIEHLFEKLTKWAFEKLGGLKLKEFKGNNNPDGGVLDKEEGSVLLWDNKSQESPYLFPFSHQKQFLQYIAKSDNKVASFLVITSDIEDEDSVATGCLQLQELSKINVGVISAEIFKAFMQDFNKSGRKPLNIQIFNHNGVITRKILEMRKRIYLKQ
jgi:hypothetical protein